MIEPDYEAGLRQVKEMVSRTYPELLADFASLESQMREILREEKLLGSDSTSQRHKARIIQDLTRFLQDHLGLYFLDFCYPPSSPEPPEFPSERQPSQIVYQDNEAIWTAGVEIALENKTYLLHNSLPPHWSADHNAVRYQAKAQQLYSNRMVWLKQVQVFNPTAQAILLKTFLEKEARLLEQLEQQRERNFPRLLADERSERTITIVYDAIQGNILSQVYGRTGQPLAPQLIPSLLQHIIDICSMLSVLHRMKFAHRNLTPDTILLVGKNRAVLEDIGLAAQHIEAGEGPQLYRAPEQAGYIINPPGPSTDIYQLGALLYHIITGYPVTSTGKATIPSKLNEAISQELDAIVLRAIALQVHNRWHTVQEFAQALKNVKAQLK